MKLFTMGSHRSSVHYFPLSSIPTLPRFSAETLVFFIFCSRLLEIGESFFTFSSAYLYIALVVWGGLDVGGFTLAASFILGIDVGYTRKTEQPGIIKMGCVKKEEGPPAGVFWLISSKWRPRVCVCIMFALGKLSLFLRLLT